MAVNTVPQHSKLKIQYDAGLDKKGNQIVKSKTYSRIKASATNEDVYSVAASLTGLQELPLISVTRIDETEIVEE